MTDQNRTEIAVILDRSGSMHNIHDDMVGGFAAFINEQKSQPGILEISLYQFDNLFETVYEGKNASEVGPLELLPRGHTALLDAVGQAIVAIGARLAAKPEHERPGAVIVLVITDGAENSSREYDVERVREMIAHHEQAYSWKFVYLGADAQGFADAEHQGFSRSVRFDRTSASVRKLYDQTSQSLSRYRKRVSKGQRDADLELDPDDKPPS